MNKIEIPLSKSKILLLLFGSIGFIILGTLFILNPDKFISPVMQNPEFIRITGIASILLFGAVGFYGIKKMFDKSAGLIIDENGIIDNTNATSVGLIKWSDIIDIRTEQVMSTKFLLIFTNNPNEILEKVSGIKRKLLETNLKMYGTPLSIVSTTLKYNFNDLEKLLTEKLSEHREKILND